MYIEANKVLYRTKIIIPHINVVKTPRTLTIYFH